MESKKMIPVFDPWIENKEIKNATKSLKEKYLGVGDYSNNFEKKCSEILGIDRDRVTAVNTGFSAIHLSCMLIGLKKNDEVIMPSFTNVADAQSVLSLGCKIIFCDILPDTLCIDPEKLEKLITKKTKLIIPIDYGSFLAEHDEIKFISKKKGVKVLHDAAHSFGSKYKKKNIGNIYDNTIFSFDPVKTFTCIDGGIIISKNKAQANKLKEMRLMGILKKDGTTTNIKRLGFRYHLANLHAAIGIKQIEKINIVKNNRLKYFSFYEKNLIKNKNLILPYIQTKNDVIPFHYVLRIKNKRDKFRDYMEKNLIQTGIHWKPLHQFKYFNQNKIYFNDLKNTNLIGKEIVTMPFHSKMKIIDLKKICTSINSFFR